MTMPVMSAAAAAWIRELQRQIDADVPLDQIRIST